jgi:hypothetical protein
MDIYGIGGNAHIMQNCLTLHIHEVLFPLGAKKSSVSRKSMINLAALKAKTIRMKGQYLTSKPPSPYKHLK